MKPLDLFQLFAVFKVAMAGTDIPVEQKLQVAREVLLTLPPVDFCSHCPATRQWIGDAIQAVIDSLQAQEHERTNTKAASAPSAPQEEAATVRPRKARKEPLGE